MRAPVYLLAVLMAIIWYYHEDAIKKALRPRPKSCVALLTLALLLMAWSLFGAREAMANYPTTWWVGGRGQQEKEEEEAWCK